MFRAPSAHLQEDTVVYIQLIQAVYRQATRNSQRELQYHRLHVYNFILLKMSTWGSKHVEENSILWINNQFVKLVINIYSLEECPTLLIWPRSDSLRYCVRARARVHTHTHTHTGLKKAIRYCSVTSGKSGPTLKPSLVSIHWYCYLLFRLIYWLLIDSWIWNANDIYLTNIVCRSSPPV